MPCIASPTCLRHVGSVSYEEDIRYYFDVDQAVEIATSREETCREGIARYRKERSQAMVFLSCRSHQPLVFICRVRACGGCRDDARVSKSQAKALRYSGDSSLKYTICYDPVILVLSLVCICCWN